MKITEYKTIAKYEDWRELPENKYLELYCITTPDGEFLFDVTEPDFIQMCDEGVVNDEGEYYLLGNPDEATIQTYAKRWGIKWQGEYQIGVRLVKEDVLTITASSLEEALEIAEEKQSAMRKEYENIEVFEF